MKKFFICTTLVFLSAVAAHLGCSLAQPRARVSVVPEADTLFSSTRFITSLAVDGEGALWAATSGGVLRRSPAGQWTKWTRRDGLPANEARKISLNDNAEIEVSLPRATALWREEKWESAIAAAPPSAPLAVDVAWNDQIYQAAPDVFRVRPKNAMNWKTIALPPSRGSHVSALLAREGVLWCALYGDGLWSFDGIAWKKLDIALPENAREITALAFDEQTKTLWLGTRREGVWQYSTAGWRQHLQGDEPLDHNAQWLQMFRGDLYMSTLDDGLQVRDEHGWHDVAGSTLSSPAPRHLIEFEDELFVRHGNGKVDSFDGANWARDVFSKELPRKKAFALATDSKKILAAQWGGWSEWDGQTWTHFLKIPELQGLPLMAILPVDETVWIGTQSRGVGEYSRKTGSFKWHDERHGLPDDWITCFAKSEKMLFAGTFIGGLAMFDGKHWKTIKELDGDNVTDIQSDGQGGVFIATRRGAWHRSRDGGMKKFNAENSWLDSEAQALYVTQNGLWIGLRTGLAFLKNRSEQHEH